MFASLDIDNGRDEARPYVFRLPLRLDSSCSVISVAQWAKFFSALSFFVTFVRFVVHSSSYFKISCSNFCTGSGSRNPIT
jgi:hypothetical protein